MIPGICDVGEQLIERICAFRGARANQCPPFVLWSDIHVADRSTDCWRYQLGDFGHGQGLLACHFIALTLMTLAVQHSNCNVCNVFDVHGRSFALPIGRKNALPDTIVGTSRKQTCMNWLGRR